MINYLSIRFKTLPSSEDEQPPFLIPASLRPSRRRPPPDGRPRLQWQNAEIEFANGNCDSTSINLKNKRAGDGCRDKMIEKTILRAFRARTSSRSQGQKETCRYRFAMSAFPKSRHQAGNVRCPLLPQQRSFAKATATSALCPQADSCTAANRISIRSPLRLEQAGLLWRYMASIRLNSEVIIRTQKQRQTNKREPRFRSNHW
jgi:hypothetical protein